MLSTADQTTAADQTTKADHEITIALEGGSVFPLEPIPEMHVGQTVRYSSRPEDEVTEVRIVFPECSPFREDHTKGTEILGTALSGSPARSVILTLLSAGELPSRCFLTLKDGTVHGWDKDHPEAGGVGKVSKP
jgi:hypothetical protein